MKRVFFLMCALIAGASCLAMRDETKTAPAPATPATKAFDRLKSLAGNWQGKGGEMECRLTYEVVANGSCVMETCEMSGHPEGKMITMYHMDGDHLMLTHYCMARNQPRMRATEFSGDGKSVTFTFIDGTNLASRDVGHMDKAVVTFTDADNFTSRWTWYANGKEDWMEDFVYSRVAKNPS